MGGDVSKLQSNFWINNLLTLRNVQDSTSSGKPLSCEQCDSRDPAVSRCTDCYVFMCACCVTAHRGTTKGHHILTMEEVKRLGSKALVKPAFCSKHRTETLKLFCQTCQKTFCRYCLIVDHHGHKYDYVAEVADEERKTLQGVLQESKTKEFSVEESLRAVRAMENCVRVKAAKINKEVDSFFDKQMKELEHLRANLKNEVTQQEEGKVKQLRSQEVRLSSLLVGLKGGIIFCDHALADGNDVPLLTVKQQVIQRLSQLNASQYQHDPCESDLNLKLQVFQTVGGIGEMARLQKTSINAVPAECVVSMAGGERGVLYTTLVGQTVDFWLTLRHEEGATENEGSCTVTAIVKFQQHGQKETEEKRLPVCDNGDGSHSFSFHPKDAGTVTLAVKIEGQNVCLSPLEWQVEAKTKWPDVIFKSTLCGSDAIFKGPKKSKVSPFEASLPGTTVLKGELQSWKLHLVSFRGRNAIEIGVQTSKSASSFGGSLYNFPEQAKWSWKYDPSRMECPASRSDGQKPSITSVEDNDVFTVFLNLRTKKLIIFNVRSKQSESFTEVEGTLAPFYTPSLRYNRGLVFGETSYLDLV